MSKDDLISLLDDFLMALDITYEDDWFVAINKPVGMLVHPAEKKEPDDQIAMKALRNHLDNMFIYRTVFDRPDLRFCRQKSGSLRKCLSSFRSVSN